MTFSGSIIHLGISQEIITHEFMHQSICRLCNYSRQTEPLLGLQVFRFSSGLLEEEKDDNGDTLMKVTKIFHFLTQDQLQMQPQYNKKISKVYTWRNKWKARDRIFFSLIYQAQNFRLYQKFIKKNIFRHKNCKNFQTYVYNVKSLFCTTVIQSCNTKQRPFSLYF